MAILFFEYTTTNCLYEFIRFIRIHILHTCGIREDTEIIKRGNTFLVPSTRTSAHDGIFLLRIRGSK